jgi:uncharacterized protein
MNEPRIIIAGGSGFIGTGVARKFARRGYAVTVLSRTPRLRGDDVRETSWDGKTVGDWAKLLDGAQAVINLTGKNINCPHTPQNVREITASRVNSVNAIAAAIAQAAAPPPVWVQASATGFYGDTGDTACDESVPNGTGTLAEICRAWEAAGAVTLPKTRKVTLRIGFVLGPGGGALPVLARLTKFFLGGAVGNGKQFISWIHLRDLLALFHAAVADEKFSGTYNAVAPNPVTNAAFMRELRLVLDRPWSPPAPALAVKLGAKLMGSEPSLALTSQRCVPKRLLDAVFPFRFTELRPALEDLCRKL